MITIDAKGNESYSSDPSLNQDSQRWWMCHMIESTDPFQDIGIGCCGVCPPDASSQLENGEFPFADND